jgi:hypothetical protein
VADGYTFTFYPDAFDSAYAGKIWDRLRGPFAETFGGSAKYYSALLTIPKEVPHSGVPGKGMPPYFPGSPGLGTLIIPRSIGKWHLSAPPGQGISELCERGEDIVTTCKYISGKYKSGPSLAFGENTTHTLSIYILTNSELQHS